jgi:D-glycero-D-manno-heptose 1,7-bisphosphate phosphatase
MKKTIFFDRDGTLIIDKVYLNDPEQIVYLPGVFESLCRLRDAGFQFVIVTNQSGVARGIVSIENLDEIHRRIQAEFARHGVLFKGFYYAPFSVESNHPMRKPNPGMLMAGARDHRADLSQSWMIGDRMTDVVAGLRAGCRTVLLEGVEALPTEDSLIQPDIIASDLVVATETILAFDRETSRVSR